jgi:ribosome-binding factor A
MQIGHIMAFLVKKGRKRVTSQINEEIFLTSILAEFLKNAKISHGSRSYVVYLSNELSHAKIQYKPATLWPSL